MYWVCWGNCLEENDMKTMTITLDNFENHVPFKIWQKGMDYYDDDAVIDLEEVTPGEWVATVEGTVDYEVELSLNGREVKSWSCDCPYDGGDVCKHVVAVVLAVRAKIEKQKNSAFSTKKSVTIASKPEHKDVSLEELMQRAKPEDYRQFVQERLRFNPELKEELIAFLKAKYTMTDERDFGKEVEDIFKTSRSSAGGYGRWNRYNDYETIDWNKVFTKVRRLFSEVAALMESGMAAPAIDVSIRFFQLLGKHYDDSLLYDEDSDVYDVCEIAEELIKEASRHASVSADKKAMLLEELRKLTAYEVYRNYEYCDMNDLMMQVNVNVQSSDDALKLLDRILEERKSSYDLYKYVNEKIDILQRLNRSDEVRKVVDKYLYLSEIREWEVDRLIDEKQYEEALQILDEGIRLAKEDNHRGTELRWIQKKIDIYEKMNDKSSLIVCNRLMFVGNGGSMEYYHKLKRSVDASEWHLFLAKLIEDTKAVSSYGIERILPDIYVEEKDFERLYTFIYNANRFDRLELVRKYGLKLPSNYASSLLAVFAIDIRDYAERNMGRNYYVQIAEMLHFIKQFKGGEVIVKKLVTEFRDKYKRRPAMMDELRRL